MKVRLRLHEIDSSVVKIFQGERPRTPRLARAAFGSRQRGAPFSTLALGRHEPSLRHWLQGFTYSIFGPSLIDLQVRTSSTTKDISLMFTLRAFGSLLGSLFTGILYDIFNTDLVMTIGYACAALCISIAPWWTNLAALCAIVGLLGLFAAAVNMGEYV